MGSTGWIDGQSAMGCVVFEVGNCVEWTGCSRVRVSSVDWVKTAIEACVV